MIPPSYSSAVCRVKFGIVLNVIQPGITHYYFRQGMLDMNDETAWKKTEKKDYNVEAVWASVFCWLKQKIDKACKNMAMPQLAVM